MINMEKTIAILFAGGSGVRMGLELPKQFVEVEGKPIIAYTIDIFQQNNNIDEIYIVTVRDYIEHVWGICEKYHYDKVVSITEGGKTAQDSIYNGLTEVKKHNDNPIVLLHDGVRPFVTQEAVDLTIECTKKNGNAVTCIPCYETILESKDGDTVNKTLIRRETFTGQAPQAFYLDDIISAHDEIRSRENGYENMVDACTIFKELGRDVYMVMGNRGNIKITTKEDLYIFKAYLQLKKEEEAEKNA